MNARIFNDDAYSAIESDLCRIHKVPDDFDGIDDEWADIKARFVERIGRRFSLEKPATGGDCGFPDWHHNIRMFWAYLYAEGIYAPRLPEAIGYALEPYHELWFGQFECYTDKPPHYANGIGFFMFHKGLLLVQESVEWPEYLAKMNVTINTQQCPE